MEDNYFTRQQAADHLGVSVRTVDRYVKIGSLTKYKRMGKTLFFKNEVQGLGTATAVVR